MVRPQEPGERFEEDRGAARKKGEKGDIGAVTFYVFPCSVRPILYCGHHPERVEKRTIGPAVTTMLFPLT